MAEETDLATACRVSVLDGYAILDTPAEREFDELAALAAQVCEAPVALVSLVAAERQWFKARVGFPEPETPLDQSICAYALAGGGVLEIEDTTRDPRTSRNTLVTGEPYVRFYAGAVLATPGGVAFGTLCVLDTVPRRLTDAQRGALVVLSRQVMRELDLRAALQRAEYLRREVDHRVKNSLQGVASFVRLQANGSKGEEARELLGSVGRRIAAVALLHQELYSSSGGKLVQLDGYMSRLAGLFAATTPAGVAVDIAFAPALVTSEQATALATIVNEVVTNAFKYAFPDGRHGTVTIRGLADAGTVSVAMADDGVGLAPGKEATGLGIRIIQASAQQMGATLAFDADGPGFGLTLAFPAARPDTHRL